MTVGNCQWYNDQDHPWAAKISKQYLLHTNLENLVFWWSWKMATTTSPYQFHRKYDVNTKPFAE
jgi:hypothetical protein